MGPAEITVAEPATENEDQPGETAQYTETTMATLADLIYKQIKDLDTPVCIDIRSAWYVMYGDQRICDDINDVNVQHSDAGEDVAVLHATAASYVVDELHLQDVLGQANRGDTHQRDRDGHEGHQRKAGRIPKVSDVIPPREAAI